MIGFLPADAHAASAPYIWVDRVDSKFVVQGLKFPGNASGTVSAGVGSLSGNKSFKVLGSGYFWIEFYAFTPDKCGAAWANVKVGTINVSASKNLECTGTVRQSTPATTTTTTAKPAAAPASAVQ